MASQVYDVIVIGAGGIGSATAYRLGKLATGKKILLLEQFEFLHRNGSSSGESRIIRRTYREESYAALMPHAYRLWDEIEKDSSTKIITNTGGLDFGEPDDPGLAELLESCHLQSVPYEELTADEAMKRFPAFKLKKHWKCVYTTQGGVVNADAATRAFLNEAQKRGVELREKQEVVGIDRGHRDYVVVRTKSGGAFKTRRVVIAPGPWANRMFSLLNLHVVDLPIWKLSYGFWPVKSEHQRDFEVGRFPVWIHYRKAVDGGVMYGFPILEEAGCIKVPPHETPHRVDPVSRSFAPNSDMIERSREHLNLLFPGKAGHEDPRNVQTCLYTMTPDHHCVVDSHPLDDRVVIGAGFHGEGFKLAPIMGEILAKWALDGQAPREYNLKAFNLERVLKIPASRM